METIKMEVEVTDTFGRESNYSWVKRYSEQIPVGTPSREVVRRAKALAGWTGHRCETDNTGDMYTIRPRRMCQVMFISFKFDGEE